jgi:DNA polymerase II large subunit
LNLVERFDLDGYYKDRLELVMDEIRSIFQDEDIEEQIDKQISLTDFMRD